MKTTRLAMEVSRAGSPLTPALSPLRGEVARCTAALNRPSLAALAVFMDCEHNNARTRRSALELQRAVNATPSPLMGESAGVRGESSQSGSNDTKTYLMKPVVGRVAPCAPWHGLEKDRLSFKIGRLGARGATRPTSYEMASTVLSPIKAHIVRPRA